MTAEISAASLEFVRVQVAAKASGAAVDPTGMTAQMAFMSTGAAPSGSDLKTASWDTDATVNPDAYYAQCLVGPGGTVTLTADTTYAVWVKLTGSPEAPLRRAGSLRVT